MAFIMKLLPNKLTILKWIYPIFLPDKNNFVEIFPC